MAFPSNLDFDKVSVATLGEMGKAISGWKKGQPRDEVALMNRMTELLARNSRCDVGVKSHASITREVSILHRKGPHQIDKYGADIAITVYLPNNKLIKTSFLQLKKTNGFACNLEKRQLDDAAILQKVLDRSFVFAIDEERECIRLTSVCDLRTQNNGKQSSKTFDSSDWPSLTNWLYNWLSCNVGLPSDSKDRNSVENLLQSCVIEQHRESIWVDPVLEHDFPKDYLPAKCWLKVTFDT